MNARRLLGFAAGLLALGLASGAGAQSIAEDVLEACEADQKQFCSQVTLGEGRLLACFFAHQDKISPRCEYALYDASVRLERLISAISYVATECRTEIDQHCANIQPGGGRIAQCLELAKDELGAGCTQAMTDVGLLK
jgi:hypothetical protein